jgi:hypothetical protein
LLTYAAAIVTALPFEFLQGALFRATASQTLALPPLAFGLNVVIFAFHCVFNFVGGYYAERLLRFGLRPIETLVAVLSFCAAFAALVFYGIITRQSQPTDAIGLLSIAALALGATARFLSWPLSSGLANKRIQRTARQPSK